MTTGIILTVLFILTAFKFVTKRLRNKNFDSIMLKIHKILGMVLLLVVMLHMGITLPLIRQRPFFMYAAGGMMTVCTLAAVISYFLRKNLKNTWIVIHRAAAVIFILFLLIHVLTGIISLNHYKAAVNKIVIQNIQLENIPDGVYDGECNTGYIYAKVEVTMKSGKVISVVLLEHRNERGKPAETITDTIVEQQKVKVDTVSGATNSSKVIMKAVENAIESAQ